MNIAARLEGIAEPGGICIFFRLRSCSRPVAAEFVDMGEQNLKNIALPVRAYAVVRDGFTTPAIQAGRARVSPLSPPRLSIVVLPFANLSGDPEQERDRKPDHGLVTDQRLVRHWSAHRIHLQGQSG